MTDLVRQRRARSGLIKEWSSDKWGALRFL
jgi:hypothetical protein